ncbi:carboxypeptidase regulatory-like domain-containing protein [Cohnella sp. AR92]|uniref:carboxypeptidase regulatory-like domain-containing protein n=1 Tax=Cohnella sp. AR92 TaxID=648716 RepID=UPI000F8D85D0|nr:carboxypeptidase regulatory-like domain-containing protein [Cohnella sp. AR92]RUS46457.1 hypothetical protein ELR57_15415 [Cohnella sp. AR92]
MAVPSSVQFVPIRVAGAIPSDPANDVSPAYSDIVGDPQFPPAYYAFDGKNAYFRIRLRGDPRSNTSFQNDVWGVLIDTDNNSSAYEWMLAVLGGSSWIALIRNSVQGANPLADLPEGSDGNGFPNFHRPINNFDLARARLTEDGSSFGGTPNYFLDFSIDTGTLFSQLAINARSPLRFLFFTSSTTRGFDRDSLPFSDVLTLNQANARAELQASAMIIDPPAALFTGEVAALQISFEVSNMGSSGASTVSAALAFPEGQIQSVSISGATVGNANYNASSRTLSWNIGNLPNGAMATLKATITLIFSESLSRTLYFYSVNGIDLLTGNSLPQLTGQQQVQVQAVGSVSGLIQNKNNGLPLSGVLVELLPPGSPQGVSTSEGGYGLSGIPPGSYTLQFTHALFQTQLIPIVIGANQSLEVNVLLVPEPASVFGTVLSALDGLPIAGATVRFLNAVGLPAGEATTDSNGSYSIAGLSAELLRVLAGAEGFQQHSVVLDLAPGSTEQLNIALVPEPGEVNGLVTTAGGQPIAGAVVTLTNEQAIMQFEVQTDSNGRYSLNQLVPQVAYLVRASAPGFSGAVKSVRAGPGEAVTVNFILKPAPGSLSGQVLQEANGNPLPGVSVSLQDLSGFVLSQASTDANGEFAIASISPGPYLVIVNEPGFANRSLSVQIVSGQDTFIVLSLTPLSGSISGTVFTEAGLPIDNALVTVSYNNVVIVQSATAEDGVFTVTGLYPSLYIVTVQADGFATESLGALVQPLENTELEFRLSPLTGSVFGTVKDEAGAVLQGAFVRVSQNRLSSTLLLTQTVSDDKGLYIVDDLPPGLYILNVSFPQFQTVTGVVEIAAGTREQLDFVLLRSPGRIAGVVLNDLSEPIAGVTVSVEIRNSTGAQVSLVFAGEDGSYTSDELAPGFYLIFIFAPGFRSDQVTREVIPGETTVANVRLLPLPGSIQGVVTDRDTGAPIAGTSINVLTQSGISLDTALSDSAGFYRLDGLRPGSYTVIAAAPLFENFVVGAIVVADTVTQTNIALQQVTGELTGSVVPPLNGVQIRLYSVHNVLLQSVATFQGGRFRFPFLKAGTYVVVASADGFSSDPVGAVVQAGGSSEAVITLHPLPGSIEGTITSEEGVPIPNATIEVVNNTEVIVGSGQSEIAGRYVVSNLPTGTLSLIVSAVGFASEIGAVQLAPGQRLTGVDFELRANPGGISGLVTDASTGLPIASAEINVRLSDASGLVVAIVATNEFGEFLVNDLRPASYAILVFAEGYAVGAIGATVDSDQITSASIALARRLGSILGRVVSEDGAAIASNRSFIKLFTIAGTLYLSLFTDESGSFFIPDLPLDTYLVSVSSAGFITNSQTVYVNEEKTVEVTVVLARGGVTITGKVTNASTGAPIEGALISENGRTGFPIETVFSDQNGDYAFRFSAAGRLTLFASAVGFGAESAALYPSEGETIVLNFALQPNPGEVFGFVTNLVDGTAIPGVEVKLFNRSQVQIATVLTDNNGQYSYPELRPGDYLCIAIASGFAASQGGFSITPGASVKYSFALQPLPAALFGTITDASTGKPLANAVVVLRPFNSFAAPLSLTTSDQNGFYSIQELLEGNYVLNLSATGYDTVQSSLFAGRGQQIRLDLSARRTTANVSGMVTDIRTGQPLPDALVSVVDRNGIIVGQGVTDRSGFYIVGSGSQSETDIIAVAQNYQFGHAASVLSPGQQASLNVQLRSSPLTISGITRNALTGAPISGVVISVLTENLVVIETVASDGDGLYAFRSLSPGVYFVTATAPTYASASHRADLTSGMSAVVNFLLPVEFGNLTGTIRDTSGRPLNLALVQLFQEEEKAAVLAARSRSRSGFGRRQGGAPVPAPLLTFLRSTVSNASGRYTLSNLPAGQLPATFSYPEKQTAHRTAIIIAGQTTVLDVVLEDEGEE